MRYLGWLAWGLLLTAAVLAEPSSGARLVQLRAVPSDTQVYDQFGYLGRADAPISLRDQEQYGGGAIEFHLQAVGYKTDVVMVNNSAFAPGSTTAYPGLDAPGIYLQPASPGAYLSYYRTPLVLASGLLVVAGLVWLRLRPKLRQANQMAHLISQSASVASTHDGVVPGRLGPYQVLEKLGRGGMGTVVKAILVDTPQSEAVAIKVLHVSSSQVGEFLPRLKRETDLYRLLHHANIVTMMDYGEQDGMVYMVLELMDGGTLTERLDPNGCSPQQAMSYLKPLCAAVQYAHDKGVVHRDLKPDNVMLTGTGLVKVTDFGLGRSLGSETLTASGDILGTPAYMAPEQICGTRFEPATDQYALGVMTFELLVGRRPFVAADPMAVIFQHVSDPPPVPSSLRPGLPPRLDSAVLRMLHKDPNQRFATVEDAWAGLKAGLEDWAGG